MFHFSRFALLALLGLVGFAAPAAAVWLGAEGQPLPFTRDEEVLDFLANAKIVESQQLAEGTNKPSKLTLEKDGVRAHAILRQVEAEHDDVNNASPLDRRFRDSYVFEVAAYEVARLLGLDNVPPAVLRTVDGRDGSVQLWVENAMSEAKRIERKLEPADLGRWQHQRQLMLFFDNLIYNFDRNHGNMLLDAQGKLWFVDHTRSFKRLPSLPSVKKIGAVERGVWEKLRALDPEVVRARLKPLIGPAEIGALLKRRELLLRHVEKLLAENGERGVLFDLAGIMGLAEKGAG